MKKTTLVKYRKFKLEKNTVDKNLRKYLQNM